jgi:DivIVA domain-containing protein
MQRWVPSERDVRELEARGKALPRARVRGYRREQVDAFLIESLKRVRRLLEENQGLRSGVDPSHLWSQPTRSEASLTPFDVQATTFEVARLGGYALRAVDELLDEVTETMMALVAENEALQRDQRAKEI